MACDFEVLKQIKDDFKCNNPKTCTDNATQDLQFMSVSRSLASVLTRVSNIEATMSDPKNVEASEVGGVGDDTSGNADAGNVSMEEEVV